MIQNLLMTFNTQLNSIGNLLCQSPAIVSGIFKLNITKLNDGNTFQIIQIENTMHIASLSPS